MPKTKVVPATRTSTLTQLLPKLKTAPLVLTQVKTATKTRQATKTKIADLIKIKLPKSSSLLSGVKQKKGKQKGFFKFTEITPVGELLNFNLKKKIKKTKK